MATKSITVLQLTSEERTELQRRARSRTLRAEDVRRARLILALDEGKSYSEVSSTLGCNRNYVSRWKQRFLQGRLSELYARHRGRPVEKRTPRLEAKILDRTLNHKPKDGSTHWSTRKLAKELRINHMMVARVWARAGIQPHRIERYMLSNDPDFESKAADIIGLYVNPPQHAVVLSVDEKTAIQALDRKIPVLPLSPGRAERHGFEYYRHGTLSLYAALNTKTGEVVGRTAARHTSAEFVAFLSDLVTRHARKREIHIIADNLSAHKTRLVEQFLVNHPRVNIHYTPTYSSWLNQIELWFGLVSRRVLRFGNFTSPDDLVAAIERFIDVWNRREGHPFRWTYRGTPLVS